MRHDDPVVRAWLQARDDAAAQPVLELLAARIRKRRDSLSLDDMAPVDAKMIAAVLDSRVVSLTPSPRRNRKRGRPSPYPGRDSRGR